jgi:hypothetical protein
MTKQEAAVLYAARRYVFHGSKGATAERMRLFKYWERRLLASAVKLGISERRRK